MEKEKFKISKFIEGSEGSSGHENVGDAEAADEAVAANPVGPDPDDTLGSRDISGSGLPRGGTLREDPATRPVP